MKDFEHLMSVWQGQPKQDQLSVDEVLKQVKKGIRSITSQLYWGIVAMVAMLAAYLCYYVLLCIPVVNLYGAVYYADYHDGLCSQDSAQLPYP